MAAGTCVAIDCIPFIRIEFVLPALQEVPTTGKGTAVFTSANAVLAYVSGRKNLPEIDRVYCLDGATLASLKEQLPEAVPVAVKSYAAELVQEIISGYQGDALYFFCGDQRLPTIPQGLDQAGIPFKEIVVYKTILQPVVLKKDYHGLLFFSPSAVSSFFSANTLPEGAVCFAIGHTTAKALAVYTERVVVAERPSEVALLRCAIDYFEKQNNKNI